MTRVWYIFVSLYAVGIVGTGLIVAVLCLMDRSLAIMHVWFGVALEGGLLLSPVVFVIACTIAGFSGLFSKSPSNEFEVPERSKRIFLVVGILFFLVIPFFLCRDWRLNSAARNGSIAKARIWLALGANRDHALSWAIIYGQRDMVDYLLKKRGHLDGDGYFATNTILWSVPNGHEDIADLLKQYGAQETGARARQDAIGCRRTPEQHRYAVFPAK